MNLLLKLNQSGPPLELKRNGTGRKPYPACPLLVTGGLSTGMLKAVEESGTGLADRMGPRREAETSNDREGRRRERD